jgi:L-alanine-DL-glutamate epimerase-like enolase superfamily enzyme
MLTFRLEKRVFNFKFPAGTSRGVLQLKKSWFVYLSHSHLNQMGVGECSIIEGLSPDYFSEQEYLKKLEYILTKLSVFNIEELSHQFNFSFYDPELENFFSLNPSIRFGFETAVLDFLNGGNGVYFNNDFSNGTKKIPINGLVWMGDEKFMKKQIEDRLKSGFTTIKLKVGAIDFNTELGLLKFIRSKYNSKIITLRVDANGAFDEKDVYEKLTELKKMDIHSIEQPIQPGNFQLMKDLCSKNIIPIALDEELIGICSLKDKEEFLQFLRPQYIILKPSLHGGIKGVREWIMVANELKIDWWMTSALESNVGLSAICQFTAEFENQLPQGLGTGSLYENNVESKLHVNNGFIYQLS